jgi:hypothetical protein
MDMAVGPLAPGVAKIVLDGRLDIARANAIDLQFNAVAGSHKAIVVDLAGVSFLASIGIRTLLLAANPGTEVERVLSVIGAAELMPIYRDTGAALAAALAHS